LVAKKLRDGGHDVVFAGESPKTDFINKEGFDVLPLYETDPDVLLGNIRKSKLKFVSDDEIERLIDADLKLYREVRPDLVLTDFRYSAPISTHIANLKHVAIVNVSSTEYRTQPFVPLFDWIPELFIKRDSPACRRFNQLNLKIEMGIFDSVMSVFKKLSGKYGIKKNCYRNKLPHR
jgi:UDP:flavonoid glycosyltransferase YjiC (YdhE family)